MLSTIDKRNVKLLPGIFRERMSVNREYLMELDTQCLLQNFYLEAGIIIPGLQVVDNPETAKLHWGWEAPTCQLRGHFLGHWLSAAAAYVASERDMELKAKLDTIIAELARCQELNGGEWIGSIPEKYFEKLENNQHIWSPQYVMHKTIMGLTHAYIDAGNEQALQILDRLSDWYVRWIDAMLLKNPHAVYSGEEAGMLEIWAVLYDVTKNAKYMHLAERYWNPSLFRKLLEGKDALTNCHANASIPFSHGAAVLYEITGDEKWRQITELFWKNAVTDRGTYCTCGQNAGEFWQPPFMSGQFLGERNQEFCTVYNMVRTASYLYKWTGNTEYADYIEKNLYNGFLAQHNAQTGMPAYFLPLAAGSRKKWGSKTRDFWCCHGTMVQAQSMYNDLIYLEDAGAGKLIISQYIPSRMEYRRGGADVCIEQTTDMKYYNAQAFFDEQDDSQMSRWSLKFKITASVAESFTVLFRVPAWVKGSPVVHVNGQVISSPEINGGYLIVTGEWKDDTINIFFPSALVMEPLPDMPELAAVVDGPIVLAGLTDSDCGLAGESSLRRF
ncbi:beta-L-arabinofuranosidase domain-containing protein [Paenibacillus sp. MMS20-IR301]|uniref:beta-L-arabinofuranosidase domain-containing protein n=1 Tax=Paenibacillus sp. MMS20-IR301 TaxID=2895946 RepID=UPI0028ED274A|nr:beta-L-arabinofuranosidase domain-containing protein [Paenibacillus sp. MMS20-IR301]WNS45217.1 glycoside hydrolase family 127 protein [Paenibacillus sp. MMS20-IR301]